MQIYLLLFDTMSISDNDMQKETKHKCRVGDKQ